jgi:hypothetical protein
MIASNTTIPDPVAWYSSRAASLAPVYEAIDPAKGYAWLAELMPTVPASRCACPTIGARRTLLATLTGLWSGLSRWPAPVAVNGSWLQKSNPLPLE